MSQPLNKKSLTFIVIAVFLSVSANELIAQTDKPNFVVIMADDLGYSDIGCFGAVDDVSPNLDRLATEGMLLTDFHSNGPVCSPTRAALLTGRYQQRAGVAGVIYADPKQNRHHGLQLDEITFADALSEVGYTCGIFGKWHLGYETQYNPSRQGFDQFWGYVSGNVCYQSHLDRMGIADWWHNAQLTPEEGYCTHLITQHTIDFIKQNKDRPFCAYVAHECVHSPFQGPDDPAIRELGKVGDLREKKVNDVSRAYREMIIEMDRGIGEIVEALEANGLAENTLVLFFSDNGATKEGSNAPWRGLKGSLWEGGHRVPFIAWQPGKVPAGTSSTTPAMTIDIMPTLLDLAEAKVSHPLDGVSLKNVIYQNESLPDRTLHWGYQNRWAIRDGNWKLVSEKTNRGNKVSTQLFDLSTDPTETTDLSESRSKITKELHDKHLAWEKEVNRGATQQPIK